MDSPKSTLASGMLWSAGQRVVSLVASLVVSTIIARRVIPEDYGIMAAANIFISLAMTFALGGFGNALIQKGADHYDCSTMFLFNTIFSLFIYGVIYVCAPFMANVLHDSFDKELVVVLIRVLGIGIVLSSFNSFYNALLCKDLKFKKVFFITLIDAVASGTVGIIMAYKDFGVWALVAQTLMSTLCKTILLVVAVRWRPQVYFSFKRFWPMYTYGVKMMLSGLMITLYSNLSGIVIGNQYDSEDLASYNKGTNYPRTFSLNIVLAATEVLFPTLSKIKNLEGQKAIVRKFNRVSAFVITPLMFGFAAVGPVFVELLLTEKWLVAVPFLQVCCISYAFQPIEISSLQYLRASGKATEYLVLDFVRKVINILLVILAVAWNRDVIWIAIADMVGNFLAIFVNMYPGKKHLDYHVWEQIWDILPKFLLSGIMMVIVYLVGGLQMPLLPKLIVQIITGVVVYTIGASLLRMRELKEVFAVARNLLFKNKALKKI